MNETLTIFIFLLLLLFIVRAVMNFISWTWREGKINKTLRIQEEILTTLKEIKQEIMESKGKDSRL